MLEDSIEYNVEIVSALLIC